MIASHELGARDGLFNGSGNYMERARTLIRYFRDFELLRNL